MGVQLDIHNLHRSFQKGGQTIHVLRGASLQVRSGDAIALVGQSGSGKSTFLQLLGGLEPPSQGEVQVDGRVIHKLTPAELDRYRNRTVGFVFQFHHLLPDHSALDNVAMPGLIARMSRTEAQALARQQLEKVGLANRIHHRPGELSGGEQQRVAIARALLLRPGLLLADEPTGNLDPSTANDVFNLLLSLTLDGSTTVVLVTHSMELAARLPRRVRLREGLFVEEA